MIEFQVDDMTCGHCSRAIEQTIRDLDPGASVTVDLGTRRVSVSDASVSASALVAAMAGQGYRAHRLEAQAVGASERPARSCCGGGRCH